jgi:hypothetical protein
VPSDQRPGPLVAPLTVRAPGNPTLGALTPNSHPFISATSPPPDLRLPTLRNSSSRGSIALQLGALTSSPTRCQLVLRHDPRAPRRSLPEKCTRVLSTTESRSLLGAPDRESGRPELRGSHAGRESSPLALASGRQCGEACHGLAQYFGYVCKTPRVLGHWMCACDGDSRVTIPD